MCNSQYVTSDSCMILQHRYKNIKSSNPPATSQQHPQMQKQYPKKLRKLLNQSKNIIPTQYQLFYTLLKQICNHIQDQDITPELLNVLSEIYHTCKEVVMHNYQIGTQESSIYAQNKSMGVESNSYSTIHKFLSNLLQPILKYLPESDTTSKLLYQHFMDNQFYQTISMERQKSEQLIVSTLGLNSMNESGSMTPLAFPKNKNKPLQSCQLGINSNSSSVSQLKLNELIKYQHTNNAASTNRLHINGNNQLSIIFWLNCFKFDYAVHFDIFWSFFQNYLNTILTQLPQSPTKPSKKPATTPIPCIYYPHIIPNTNNSQIKQRIKQIVDVDNKYYITSANCNDLFVCMNQPEFISELTQLTIKKEVAKEEYKSTCCVNLLYRWKQGKGGQVSINNYLPAQSSNNAYTQPLSPLSPTTAYLKTLKQSQQIAQNKQIYITGTSIAYSTKIMHNKYPPTIRFGSLQDNQIVVKNRYISRRQFMIIEELEEVEQSYDKKYESNYATGDKSIRGSDYCIMQSSKPKQQSVYYLVCLSPSNHTTVVYNHRIQAKSGLIFKINGIHIQVVRFVSVYGGREDKKQYLSPIKEEEQSHIKIDNISESSQSSSNIQNMSGSVESFQLLTSLPNMKTEQDEQQAQKTLQQLPTNKSLLIINNQLQCMYISGENRNKKFTINTDNKWIRTSQDSVFELQVEDGIFYVPKGTEILAKCANQVLSGHFSDKVKLSVGMKIVLEEIQFLIVE